MSFITDHKRLNVLLYDFSLKWSEDLRQSTIDIFPSTPSNRIKMCLESLLMFK